MERISEWISVKERLPNENYESLKKEYGDFMSDNAIDYGVEFLTFDETGVISVSDFWVKSQRFDEGITHWMPLPNPPEV